MYVSLRSSLTAGTVAVVGAGAIALAPVAPTEMPSAALAVPTAAEVALTAMSLPFDIVGLLQNLGIGGALPGIVDALPSLLPTDLVTAILNEFAAEAGPLLTTAAGEVFGYFGTAVSTLLATIPQRIGAAVMAVPAVLASAVQSLSTGDLPTALETLSTGILAPITAVTRAIQDAGADFQAFVSDQIATLGSQLPGVLFTSIQTVMSGNFQSVLDAVQEALSGLFGGLSPAAGSLPVAAVRSAAATTSAVVTIPVAVQAVPRAAAAASAAEVAAVRSVNAEAHTASAPSAEVAESAHASARVARQAKRPVMAAVPDAAAADSVAKSASAEPAAPVRSSAAKRDKAAASDSAPARGR